MNTQQQIALSFLHLMNENNYYKIVSALVCCHPTIQRGVPGGHVHNFRVCTMTISDINLLSLIFQP